MIGSDPGRVWELVSDPHSLPRWWPRTLRVEDVGAEATAPGGRWTAVLETGRGSAVRADYRCVAAERERRLAWEQEVANTPFERILRSAGLEIGIGSEPEGTRVTLTSDEALRGLSRLGALMMRGAARRRLDEALDGIERALVGETDG